MFTVDGTTPVSPKEVINITRKNASKLFDINLN